jgi:hypothetical protein
MYGAVARYRPKSGMEDQLLAFEREIQEANLPGLVTEYTFRMDDRFPSAGRPLLCGRGSARSLPSLFAPGCEKRASGWRAEALALRTRARAVGQARQARTEGGPHG